MDNPLDSLLAAFATPVDHGLPWLWAQPGWVWIAAGAALSLSLLIGRRLSRIGYRERSVWVSPERTDRTGTLLFTRKELPQLHYY